MDTKKLEEEYRSRFSDPVEMAGITACNFKPHAFVIGAKHVTEAANRHGGMLTDAVLEKIPCAQCHRPLSEHTYDTVVFLKLKRNCTSKEFKEAVLAPMEELEKLGVAGLCLVETPQQYRIGE